MKKFLLIGLVALGFIASESAAEAARRRTVVKVKNRPARTTIIIR